MCCLFTYYESFPNYWKHQTDQYHTQLPKKSHIVYTRTQSSFYQYVINLAVSLSIKRGPGLFMNVWVSEHPDCLLWQLYSSHNIIWVTKSRRMR